MIAPVYNLFFKYQVNGFKTIFERAKQNLSVLNGSNILDIGCGTGALAFYLTNIGYKVTGVDASRKMINMAKKNNKNNSAIFIVSDVLKGLPFPDKRFDLVISSFVAHGFNRQSRLKFFAEASRLANQRVIIHDFNQKRRWITDIMEWTEGGNYFSFIQNAEKEMKTVFSDVRVVSFADQVAWYICSP